MPSIIIPAHDEAEVIARCLAPLLPALGQADYEVIVVCNGCTDRTAEVVAGLDPRLLCLETETPSKVHALNLGDREASCFPRIYLDADIVLSPNAVELLCKSLEGELLVAAPEVAMNYAGASWAVRAYYEVWLSTPYCKSGMMGAGTYALSKAARKRFGDFPDVIADDGYVRRLFQEHERGNVPGSQATVRAPKTLSGLIKIKTRSRLGNRELELKFPELAGNEAKDYSGALKELLPKLWLWPKLLVYAFVTLATRWRAKRRWKRGELQWERDDSSRAGEHQGTH